MKPRSPTLTIRKPYNWVRVRLLGGRSLFWSRQSFRLSDFEFKAAEIDGTGTSWPIRLADLDPYYSRVEGIFRVSGRKEGWPQFPDGNFIERPLPAGQPDHQEGHRSVHRTRHRRFEDALVAGRGRPRQLHQSAAARCAGHRQARIVPNAIVREISVDKNTGLVNGAHFVDRHSRREMHVKAKVVVLAAGTLESTRLLLNSGIANSSGVMGHYLHDQIYGVNVTASVPEARDGKGHAAGLMGGQAFMPRFRNLKKAEKRNFIKGYCMRISSGGGANANMFADYGEELQKKLDHYAGLLRLREHLRRARPALRKSRPHQQEREGRLGHSRAAHRGPRWR